MPFHVCLIDQFQFTCFEAVHCFLNGKSRLAQIHLDFPRMQCLYGVRAHVTGNNRFRPHLDHIPARLYSRSLSRVQVLLIISRLKLT